MKTFLTFLIFCFSISGAFAQNLKPGYYVTDDGVNSREITMQSDGTIKASMSVGYDIYERMSGNTYKGKSTFVNGELKPASRVFYLEILSESSIYLYREGQPKTILRLQTTKKILTEAECPLHQKYMDKMEDEPQNIQVLAFCANAALQLCNAPDDEARRTILKTTITTLKGLQPGKPCPCSDVIPAAEWNKY
jgi:hypothetical protein